LCSFSISNPSQPSKNLSPKLKHLLRTRSLIKSLKIVRFFNLQKLPKYDNQKKIVVGFGIIIGTALAAVGFRPPKGRGPENGVWTPTLSYLGWTRNAKERRLPSQAKPKARTTHICHTGMRKTDSQMKAAGIFWGLVALEVMAIM
jgi:hypothetical protein